MGLGLIMLWLDKDGQAHFEKYDDEQEALDQAAQQWKVPGTQYVVVGRIFSEYRR